MAFPTTRWTLLAEATLDGDSAGQAALTRMCEAYRRPIEEYLRSRGCKPQEIEEELLYLRTLLLSQPKTSASAASAGMS